MVVLFLESHAVLIFVHILTKINITWTMAQQWWILFLQFTLIYIVFQGFEFRCLFVANHKKRNRFQKNIVIIFEYFVNIASCNWYRSGENSWIAALRSEYRIVFFISSHWYSLIFYSFILGLYFIETRLWWICWRTTSCVAVISTVWSEWECFTSKLRDSTASYEQHFTGEEESSGGQRSVCLSTSC